MSQWEKAEDRLDLTIKPTCGGGLQPDLAVVLRSLVKHDGAIRHVGDQREMTTGKDKRMGKKKRGKRK